MESNLVKSESPVSRYLGDDVVHIINEETPLDWIESRPIRGGGRASYVAGHHFVDKLNQAFGFLWSAKVKDWKIIESSDGKGQKTESQLAVLRTLTIHIPGRKVTRILPDGTKEVYEFESVDITREQFGGSDVKRYAKDQIDPKTGDYRARKGDIIDLADDLKGASTDALKKCALEIGFFSDIYSKRGEEGSGPTAQQLEALYMRGADAGMSQEQTDAWILEETGKRTKDLEQVEAMGLIPRLMDLAEKK